jgi:transposase
MDHVGIDLHKRESQICIETAEGEVIERRIRTERDRFVALFDSRPKARILLEAMTESEWVARCLEELGHEVIVADPNYAAMYASRSRRVKTDRRACRPSKSRASLPDPGGSGDAPAREAKGHVLASPSRSIGLW